jgi:hypothetical protein
VAVPGSSPAATAVAGRHVICENLGVMRRSDESATAASTYSRLPAGDPQGYQDAFNAYIPDVYAASRGMHRTAYRPSRMDGARRS